VDIGRPFHLPVKDRMHDSRAAGGSQELIAETEKARVELYRSKRVVPGQFLHSEQSVRARAEHFHYCAHRLGAGLYMDFFIRLQKEPSSLYGK